jgi:hypothetical protein
MQFVSGFDAVDVDPFGMYHRIPSTDFISSLPSEIKALIGGYLPVGDLPTFSKYPLNLVGLPKPSKKKALASEYNISGHAWLFKGSREPDPSDAGSHILILKKIAETNSIFKAYIKNPEKYFLNPTKDQIRTFKCQCTYFYKRRAFESIEAILYLAATTFREEDNPDTTTRNNSIEDFVKIL